MRFALRWASGPTSLLISFTTPDVSVETFAKKEYDRAKAVAANRASLPDYLPIIFEASEQDEPFDRQTWVKAAPALESGFLDWAAYESEAHEAKLDPTALHSFKVYRLAIWADSGHGYLDMTLWDRNISELPDREYLASLPCFFGLDMALNEDLTSLAMIFRDDHKGCLWAIWRHWMTDVTFRRVNNFTHGDFGLWVKEASVDIHEYQGNYVDGREVADQTAELALEFKPFAIGVDSFRSREMHKLLGEDGYGFQVDLLSQTGRSMQAATERISAEVAAQRLLHNGDGVARWAAANCEVKYDVYGFPKVLKLGGEPKSPIKIDPIDALLMACDRMLQWEKEGEQVAEAWLPPEYDDGPFGGERAPDRSELVVGSPA